jgi:hypothetical protein
MKAVHLVCRRGRNGSLEGMTVVEAKSRLCESNCWAFRDVDRPEQLVGGWVYFHPTKGSPSEFGGVVEDVRPALRADKAQKEGYTIFLTSRPEGKGQRWRGADHQRAWTGGIVDASLPHERVM